MTKNIFKKSLTLFTFALLAAATMVGCKKDDVKPDDPNTPDTPDTPTMPEMEGYVLYGEDSIAVDFAMFEDMDGMYIVNVQLSNGSQFGALSTTNIIDAGPLQFADIMTIIMGGDGVCGSYTITEDDYDDLTSGQIEVKTLDELTEILATGTTESGKNFKLYFKGQLVNLSKPTGTGSITFGGQTYPVDLNVIMKAEGVYEYFISDTRMFNTMSVFVNSPMTVSTTYNFTSDQNAFMGNNTLAMGELAIVNAAGDDMIVEDGVTSGTVATTVDGKNITINVNGTTPSGDFTVNYTGTSYAAYVSKMAKRVAKMRAK